ncbi:MAG: nucleotidyltransferase domain-containing protein [Chloroflexota bacterium]
MTRTALELSPEERKMYRPGMMLHQRTEEDQRRLTRRYDQAWRLARRAATLLRRQYGASRVVVFGSLAHAAWFNAWSDIDLAAWGIPPERFYAAVAAVTGLSPRFKVDLLDAEACRSELLRVIEGEGVEI